MPRPYSSTNNNLAMTATQNQHDDITANQSGSTAIILNLNARSVISNSHQLISLASNIVGTEHVYVTRTVDDALLAARAVVRSGVGSGGEHQQQLQQQQPYSLVVPIGGDGTLSACLDSMVNEILLLDKLNNNNSNNSKSSSGGVSSDSGSSGGGNNMMKVHEAIDKLPCIGYIPMGTGNGLGYVIGCRMPRRRKTIKSYNNSGENGDEEDDYDDNSRDDDGKKKKKKKKKWSEKLLSRISIKRRKVEHAGRVMKRLKQIGDELQQQQLSGQTKRETGGGGNHLKYSIVEMPMMEVTHHSPTDDEEEQEQRQQQQSSQQQQQTKGDLCFFAGSGFDSLMLEDFKQVKAWSKSPKRKLPSFIKDMLSSVAGYSVALVTRTLPQTLMHQTHKIHVKVTTTDEETLWVDHRRGDFSELAIGRSSRNSSSGTRRENNERDDDDGKEGGNEDTTTTTKRKKKKKQSHLIYSGTTGILAASTTPFYGGGLRLFPYARLFPMKLQLRIGRISPLTGFLRIPSIFEGSYRDKSDDEFGCLDFIGDDFEVEVSGTRYEEYLKRKNEYEEEKKSNSNKRGWWRWKRWVKRGGDDDVSSGDETTSTTITPTHTNSSVPDESSSPSSLSQKGFPFQHSGESMGIKEMFRVRVIKKPVKFISFKTPRIVVDD